MTYKYHGRIKFCVNLLLLGRSSSYLDIGCGTGWALGAAAEFGVGFAVGIDTDERALVTCKRRSKANVVVASALQLPFKNAAFDTISAWDVVEHLPLQRESYMFKEFITCLKFNGICIISTPYNSKISNYLDPAWWIGHRHYSVEQMVEYASVNSLEIEKYYIKGGIIDIIATVIFYINIWILGNQNIINKWLDMSRDYDYSGDQQLATLFCQFRRK